MAAPTGPQFENQLGRSLRIPQFEKPLRVRTYYPPVEQ